jgi:hypothetical protein
LFGALSYKSEGRRYDSRWNLGFFSDLKLPDPEVDSASDRKGDLHMPIALKFWEPKSAGALRACPSFYLLCNSDYVNT